MYFPETSVSEDTSFRVIIDPQKVCSFFNQIDIRKSTGPDGISAALLKSCAEELTIAWCPVFQRSVDCHTVPDIWKKSVIVPLPKISCPVENNDYRQIALTSCVMKCFERYMVSLLKTEVKPVLDPLQFAYRQGRGTVDAINNITYAIVKHLENPKAYARLLFVDFSSAFDTVKPHCLIKKLRQLGVNPLLLKWYYSFLTDRRQQVKVNHSISEVRRTSTGVPQGCVSSPILFTLYTNDCTSHDPSNLIIKYSDDTALLSLLYNDTNPSVYYSEAERFAKWCDLNHLIINIKKTEEMVFDPKLVGNHSPVFIHEEPIKQVCSYKYLGVYMDNLLTWGPHVDSICSRVQQRLHFLRRQSLRGSAESNVSFLPGCNWKCTALWLYCVVWKP